MSKNGQSLFVPVGPSWATFVVAAGDEWEGDGCAVCGRSFVAGGLVVVSITSEVDAGPCCSARCAAVSGMADEDARRERVALAAAGVL